jgi:inositol oxygenase
LQTAEAIRKVYSNDTNKDWMPLVGLIHDMGKILYVNGNDSDGTSKATQWALVGDTFITGCPIPKNIVLAQYNELNLDNENSNENSNEHSNEHTNNSKNKYTSGCGLSNCSVSFGHDEYMYRLLIANTHKMPKEAEYIVRYHSLYTWHSGTEYDYLEDDEDKKMKNIVKEFNNFDLYTKDDTLPIKWSNELIKYYSALVIKYISPQLQIKW